MSRRFLKVIAHPLPQSLVRSAGDAAEESLRLAGHEVRTIDLYADGFDPVVSRAEWWSPHDRGASLRGALSNHIDGLSWATDLLLVYPTWYGGGPAMLKGWFDRLWVGELSSKPDAVLRVRNISNIWVVTSHGSPRYMNKVGGESGKKFVSRVVRFRCARLCRVRWVAFYGNDLATHNDRIEFLASVTRRFSEIG